MCRIVPAMPQHPSIYLIISAMSMYSTRRYVYIANMTILDGGVGLRVLACTYQCFERWRYANLSAPYWRVYWNATPGWHIMLNGRATALTPDRLVIIPPETPFSARSRQPSFHLFIHFVADAPYDSAAPAVCSMQLGSDLRTLVEELASRAAQGDAADGRGSVLVRLVCYQALSRAPFDGLSPIARDGRVRRALTMMSTQLGRPLPNGELARACGMSTNAFIRLFSAETGQSPQAWYVRRRVDYACELLHHSRLSIEQIAETAGFHDRAHFSKVFKKLRGIAPAAFRRTGRPVPHGAAQTGAGALPM
ncbi:MAG: helix-turn-helix domain-containing protein [Chitinivibrionales bacterium]|nr:helix-turn-helix domain-containing protein [Chitinivibrionales bacterium]